MVTTTGEGMPPLKEWVKHELEGYPAEVPIPDYRIFRAHNKGHFIGVTFQGELEIPVSVLPESLRPFYAETQMRSSIAECVQLVSNQGENGSLRRPWPVGVAVQYGSKFANNAQCVSAWTEVSTASMVSLIEQVKTKVLSFALEIDEADPTAGDVTAPTASPQIRSDLVTQIFNTTINGGTVQNVAMGAKTAKQSVINGVEPGDLPSLLKALQSIGVDEADIKSLTAALDDDKSTVKNGIGAKSKRWLAKLGQKAGEKVAEKGADSLVAGVTQALALYFGAAT